MTRTKIEAETITPKSEQIDERKPRMQADEKDYWKRKRKESKKMMEKGNKLCYKVQRILRDPDKYIEFLRQLYLYSKGVVDLTEFLNLVDDRVRENQRLMSTFDDFLEQCEESRHRSHLVSLCRPS